MDMGMISNINENEWEYEMTDITRIFNQPIGLLNTTTNVL